MMTRRTMRMVTRRGMVSFEIVDASDDSGVISGDPIATTAFMSRAEAAELLAELAGSVDRGPIRRRLGTRRPVPSVEVSADGTEARLGVRDAVHLIVAGDPVVWSAWQPADRIRQVVDAQLPQSPGEVD